MCIYYIMSAYTCFLMLFFFTSIGIKLKKNEKYNVYKYNNNK